MKFIDEVSPDKLRGGFYTPEQLVAECYRRIAELLGSSKRLHILEPSAGEGRFIKGAPVALSRGYIKDPTFTCVELIPEEAAKCEAAIRKAKVDGSVVNRSFFEWAKGRLPVFDAAVGNPPFVRYQFVPKSQREDADFIFAEQGKVFDGVSNLWIPFFLITLQMLREGGAFAFVLPGELFSTKSTGVVRSELIRHFEKLQVDFYERGTFEGILQDVVVLSGVKTKSVKEMGCVTFVDHTKEGERTWSHDIDDSKDSWTRYLLTKAELKAFETASKLPEMHRLGDVATIGVSIVTGANDFFTVEDSVVDEYELHKWAKPLLARTVDSPGIVFKASDHSAARKNDKKAWILDFSKDLPDPLKSPKAVAYLKIGESQGLPDRYKCRIRTPWYRVPDVRHDYLMVSKRAHQFHRLILNTCEAHTTDTIYRGHMKPLFGTWRKSLAGGFHNSLTVLSSEIEGRTYGGGVLELVPSELSRLIVPLIEVEDQLTTLDKICRKAGGQLDQDDTLIHATNDVICKMMPSFKKVLPELESARHHLRTKRFIG